MKAIEDLHRYVAQHRNDDSAKQLVRLSRRLAKEESLPLSDLYALDWEGFQLAIELMRDWRIDRHYADRIRLPDAR